MEVLILSKTKYGSTQVCVGGICVNSKQFIRLLNQGGYYQPADTKFNIGDIWEISFTTVTSKREPHNEDVTIHSYSFVRKIYQLETYIKNMGVPIWKNNITNIFEGKILWQGNGKGYFSENRNNYPSHSVGFWISDIDLKHQKVGNQDFYIYQNNGISRQIVYKGNQNILPVIPKGQLIRLSLAKWWKPDDSDIEERCYLQLSGWYEDQKEPVRKVESIPIIERKPIIETKPFAKPQVNKIESKPIIETKPTIRQQTTTRSYEPPKYQAPKTTQQPKNTSGSCYIATLCYNDYYADEVCSFRDFRDITLNKYKLGRQFIENYYRFAPRLTTKLANHKKINKAIKHLILNPLLTIIKKLRLDKE
jgi:hypothetical protein